jgi:hypothetical protein
MQGHTVEAESILDAKALRMLELRSASFLKTWTLGVVTEVQPGSIVLQRMDGELQTIQVAADTATQCSKRLVEVSASMHTYSLFAGGPWGR